MEDRTEPLAKTRRQLLQSAGATAALGALTGIAVGDTRDKVTLPTAKRGDKVIHTKTYPRSWVDHVNKVEREKNKVSNDLLGQSTVHSVGVVANKDQSYGGLTGHKIRVTASDKTQVPEIESNTIPIEIKQEPRAHSPANCSGRDSDDDDTACNWNDNENKKSLGGGLEIHSDFGYGTSTCRVFDGDADEYRLLTAWHVVANDNCTTTINPITYNGYDVGSVDRYDNLNDFASINITNSRYTQYGIDGADNYLDLENVDKCRDYDGHATKTHIQTALSKSTEPYEPKFMGCVSGYSGGHSVEEILMDKTGPDCIYLEECVKTTSNSTLGDSGGVSFFYDRGNWTFAKILGHLSLASEWIGTKSCHGDKIYNNNFYVPAYYLNNNYNIFPA